MKPNQNKVNPPNSNPSFKQPPSNQISFQQWQSQQIAQQSPANMPHTFKQVKVMNPNQPQPLQNQNVMRVPQSHPQIPQRPPIPQVRFLYMYFKQPNQFPSQIPQHIKHQNQSNQSNYGFPQHQSGFLNQNTHSRKPQNFGDDEPIDIKEQAKPKNDKVKKYNLNENIDFTIKPKQRAFKLSPQSVQSLPVVVSLKTKDFESEDITNRAGVDLFCVVDISGSMDGVKLDLVKQTLIVLLKYLTDKDRLCIILFDDDGTRLFNLRRINKQNIDFFKQKIRSINSGGGTDIASGMDIAIQAMNGRRIVNTITSVFLMTDGQDGQADFRVKELFKKCNHSFTINCFGFGQDHDPLVMTNIAQSKHGNFYYIEKLDTLDECFVDALGGLVSVVGKDIRIEIVCQPNEPYQGVSIRKVYGDLFQAKVKHRHYVIKLAQIMSGVSKDFVMELQVPAMPGKVGDHQRNGTLVSARVQVESAQDGQMVQKQATLVETFYNSDETIQRSDEDEDVVLNYYRVLGAEVIDDARRACEQGQYDVAQKNIQSVLQEMKKNKVVQTKGQQLFHDIEYAQQVCQPQTFETVGQKQICQIQNCHMYQQSAPQQFSKYGIEQQTQLLKSHQNQQVQFQPLYGNKAQGSMLANQRLSKH